MKSHLSANFYAQSLKKLNNEIVSVEICCYERREYPDRQQTLTNFPKASQLPSTALKGKKKGVLNFLKRVWNVVGGAGRMEGEIFFKFTTEDKEMPMKAVPLAYLSLQISRFKFPIGIHNI